MTACVQLSGEWVVGLGLFALLLALAWQALFPGVHDSAPETVPPALPPGAAADATGDAAGAATDDATTQAATQPAGAAVWFQPQPGPPA